MEYDLPQSGHWYLGDVDEEEDVDDEEEEVDEFEDTDDAVELLETPDFSIFGCTIALPADVLPADDLPLSLPGDDKSSGVTGGGDLNDPEPSELVGDRPQWSGLAQCA